MLVDGMKSLCARLPKLYMVNHHHPSRGPNFPSSLSLHLTCEVQFGAMLLNIHEAAHCQMTRGRLCSLYEGVERIVYEVSGQLRMPGVLQVDLKSHSKDENTVSDIKKRVG